MWGAPAATLCVHFATPTSTYNHFQQSRIWTTNLMASQNLVTHSPSERCQFLPSLRNSQLFFSWHQAASYSLYDCRLYRQTILHFSLSRVQSMLQRMETRSSQFQRILSSERQIPCWVLHRTAIAVQPWTFKKSTTFGRISPIKF